MMHAADQVFFGVPSKAHQTSEGPVDLPIRYFDATNVIALFWGDRDFARRKLAEDDLEPALVRGDKALTVVSAWEYRETTVGSYNEVGVAVFSVPRGQRPGLLSPAELLAPPAWRNVGAYVLDLPVTTAAACAAGRDLWGYPKFVTRIPFLLDRRALYTSVFDPSGCKSICEMEGRLGPGMPAPPVSLMTYSRNQGILLRTHVNVRGSTRVCLPGTTRLRLGGASHPMAENLRGLRLDSAVPMVVLVNEHFQSLLHGGQRVPEAAGGRRAAERRTA